MASRSIASLTSLSCSGVRRMPHGPMFSLLPCVNRTRASQNHFSTCRDSCAPASSDDSRQPHNPVIRKFTSGSRLESEELRRLAKQFHAWSGSLESNTEPVGLSTEPIKLHGFIVTLIGTSTENLCCKVAFDQHSNRNALGADRSDVLTTILNLVAKHPRIRGIFLTANPSSSGKTVFCSGADLGDLKRISGARQAKNFIQSINHLCQTIRDLPFPVVALINGPCIGAGLELAASCDIRVATRQAKFSMPEVLLGIPSVIEARLLCDIVGWGRARHLMLTGHPWSAEEAREAGLITGLFEHEELMESWAVEYATQLNRGTRVYGEQKKLMRSWETTDVDKGIHASVGYFATAMHRQALSKSSSNSKGNETFPIPSQTSKHEMQHAHNSSVTSATTDFANHDKDEQPQ